jgi:RNase P subunit RPR2
MQIRCQQCHKPFALGKEQVIEALNYLAAEKLQHYNVNCPHCRRMMRVSRKELLRSAPDWKEPEETQL